MASLVTTGAPRGQPTVSSLRYADPLGSEGPATSTSPHSPPLFSTPHRSLQSSAYRPLAVSQQHSSTPASLLHRTRSPSCNNSGSQDAAFSDSDLSDLEEEEEEEEGEEDFYKSSREQQWSDKEYQALCSSFKRNGRNWRTVLKDVEAAEGNKRTLAGVKAAFYRLRSKGVIKEAGKATSETTPQRTTGDNSSASQSGIPFKKKRKFGQGHQWQDEEKRFLLKMGDKHHASRIHNKEAAVYQDWKQKYPSSTLTSHVVSGYYYHMKKQQATARARRNGTTRSSASTSRASRGQQGASSSQRLSASGASRGQRLMGLGLTWTTLETDTLEEVHRMGLIKKPDWHSTLAVFEAFRRLLPNTKRTHNAVRNKLINTYYKTSRANDEEEEEEGSTGSEGESVDDGESEQAEEEATFSTELSSMEASQQGVAFQPKDSPLFASSYAVPQAALQPARLSSLSQSHSSTPAPKLSLSFTLTENGIDFEDVPFGVNIAVFSPVSFKFLDPQEVAALERGMGIPSAQQQHEVPAFAFQVLEGGTVRMLRLPTGTTTSVRIVSGGSAAAGGRGGSSEGGRMGVETRIVGADFYTLRLITWL